MRRLIFVLPVALVGFALFLFVLGLMEGTGSSYQPDALIGTKAPAIDLPNIDPAEPRIVLAENKHNWVLLNFFASWCLPCRAEHPYLMKLRAMSAMTSIGIAYKNKPEDAANFLKELGNPFQDIGLDEEGRAAISFGVTGVPETFLIDPNGIIRYHLPGPLSEETIESEILPLLQNTR